MQIFSGDIAHVVADPFTHGDALQIIENGAFAVDEQGTILALDKRDRVTRRYPDAVETRFDGWVLPGMIDGHIHFPQTFATAAHGTHLLDWLERSVFPAEAAYADEDFARSAAETFVDQLLRSGTTTALVFGSQFPGATRALFQVAAEKGLRIISGLTLMDQGAPDALLHTVPQAEKLSRTLIEEVEKEPKLHYALTPRFALSCTAEMMTLCGELARAYDGLYIQTHINENGEEIEATAAAFPEAANYLDVYDRFGLLGSRTVLAHNIHTCDAQLKRLGETGTAVCHCPASNFYLGSGIFSLKRHRHHGVPVLVGTDIGAGTNFGVLEELGSVYKAQQMQRLSLNAAQLLYLGTLAGAEALQMADRIGNFAVGKQADFVVIDTAEDPGLRLRLGFCHNPEDALFTQLNLVRPHHVRATAVAGRLHQPRGHGAV
ncbi:guanine deaminase [Acanthopleuribacter pedis]